MMKHSHVRCEFGYGIIIPLVKDKHDDLSSSDNYRVITGVLLYLKCLSYVFCISLIVFFI